VSEAHAARTVAAVDNAETHTRYGRAWVSLAGTAEIVADLEFWNLEAFVTDRSDHPVLLSKIEGSGHDACFYLMTTGVFSNSTPPL
jgi:hypothetical protein